MMNYKLEKFWNVILYFSITPPFLLWTINLKSFEIAKYWNDSYYEKDMNYKLEKFWNDCNKISRIKLIYEL